MKRFLAIALLLIFVTPINILKSSFCNIFIEAFRAIAPETVEVAYHVKAGVSDNVNQDCGNSYWACPCKVALCGCGIIPAIVCLSCCYEAAKGCRCCVMEQPK